MVVESKMKQSVKCWGLYDVDNQNGVLLWNIRLLEMGEFHREENCSTTRCR